jgi:hypothetical protein
LAGIKKRAFNVRNMITATALKATFFDMKKNSKEMHSM